MTSWRRSSPARVHSSVCGDAKSGFEHGKPSCGHLSRGKDPKPNAGTELK